MNSTTIADIAAAGEELDVVTLTEVVGGAGRRPGHKSLDIQIVVLDDGSTVSIERPDAGF